MTKTDAATSKHDDAYDAFNSGRLWEASGLFEALLAEQSTYAPYHYMQGLVEKYRRNWTASLKHNLRAIELADEFEQAYHWNAAIAATALGQWATARKLWSACEINIPKGDGEIEADFGTCVVRLNAWSHGETVWIRRIDPVRGRILNVPLPESGHRFGDIVLHDGAAAGYRYSGDRKVPVLNELQRLHPSNFQTFIAFVTAPNEIDATALEAATAPGIGYAEDWTDSIHSYCLRCSYGAPHRHDEAEKTVSDWNPHRNIGIAAQSRRSVEKLLGDWQAAGPGRDIEAIESRECAIPELEDGHVWWRGPDDEDEQED